MATPTSGISKVKTGRPRGRRAAPRVPCDDCIARATEKQEEGASIELCEKCTATLHRPRRKQQDLPNTKRIRRQSNAIIDTALGVHGDPVGIPWSNNQQEQHSVEFFINHSSSQLAGYFDSPFWQRIVLQAGQHEPSVRHAIVAIGALHEKLLTGTVNLGHSHDKRTQFALEQCNKSIQHLVKPNRHKTKPDLQLMLTTCVLFTCFEALQGHCEQAIVHATQGYNLLQQYAMKPESKRCDVGAFAVELDQLCLLMRRLQKGSTRKDFNITLDAEAINARRPTTFSSLEDAQSALELAINQLTVFFLDMELDDEFYDFAVSDTERQSVFSLWLAGWEKAFSIFLSQNQATLSEEDRQTAMILKSHHLVAEIFANVDLTLNELGWDACHDKFAAIVNLATVVLTSSQQMETSMIAARWKTNGCSISAPTATLSFSLGIVDPLYEVCSRCRDPALRRQALALLAKHPRQECVWSSWSAWKVGKFLMRLEEDGNETHSRRASPALTTQSMSEGWLNLPADDSTEPAQESQRGYEKAIPRATARYALNPGLFEDWNPEQNDFESHSWTSLVTLGPTNFSAAQSTLAFENSAAFAAAIPDEFAWIDFGELPQITDIPLIRATPPQD